LSCCRFDKAGSEESYKAQQIGDHLKGQTNNAVEPVGTLDVALAHAARLLQKDALLAAEQASEILKAVPGHPHARLILGAAHRIRGQTRLALEVLEPLAREQPRSAPAHLELAIAQGEAGSLNEAIASLRLALQLKPDSADAWRVLADYLDLAGDPGGADQARARHLRAATKDPRLLEAAALLVANELPEAEARLRSHLARYSTDIAALRMLAEVAARLRRYSDSQTLLERCLELSPSFDAARHNYAVVLNRQGKAAAALQQVATLLAREPRNPGYLNLKAAVLANLGDYAESIEVYEAVLKDFPRQPMIWMSYGHSLKTARRQDESVAAYRRAIAMQPTLGEAYWSLANLKTFRFSDADLVTLRRALDGNDLRDEDRLHFEFSLAKALEDAGAYEESFVHYSKGNAIRRLQHPFSAEDNALYVSRSKRQYSAEFFAARKSAGAQSADPIFIIGLPRAGSTLLEQILASHSLVEGTMELPVLPQIARELAGANEQDREAPFFDSVAASVISPPPAVTASPARRTSSTKCPTIGCM
jgi:tetratricopeptide (TPR) repeat protein